MKKQWHNLTTLLMYSNATPFKDRNDAGFVCAYCFKTYPTCEILRAHTHAEHDKEKVSYKAGSCKASFVAFLDIVDLKCTLCNQQMDSLQTLTEHLVTIHEKKYYLGITDYFQPFKLTNEQQINCCLCDEVFHNMKLLMQHMNVHYRNFICTTCGAGFVNSFRLNRHETTHLKKKASFPCRHCDQVFAAESKKKAHVNTEHKGIAGDSVCQICKARFKNYYQKTRHMMQVHNVEGIKCDQCEKKFNLKSNLMLHMRSVHLKERPYECSVCSMGFFIKRHMLGHYMATHTNERKFKCEVCGKAYATQNSKRRIETELAIKLLSKAKKQQDTEKTDKEQTEEGDETVSEKTNLKIYQVELFKQRFNVHEILLSSNATPIRKYDIGFVCCFCDEQFIEAQELKTHTISSHGDKEILDYTKGFGLRGFLVKLDVTGLQCNLCNTEMDSVEDLMHHLKDDHEKPMFTDIKSYIIPFIFEDSSFKCTFCELQFNKFKVLQEHMYTHYDNFVCDICGSGFVNEKMFNSHSDSHKVGIFKCGHCPEEFETPLKKKYHEKTAHFVSMNKCNYCGEKFMWYSQKCLHIKKVHGIKVNEPKECKACDKVFSSDWRLQIHIRRDHLLERSFKCTECDMAFFAKDTLTQHMVRHSGVKSFSCNVCSKAYTLKKGLREHMRIHDNDRRFKWVPRNVNAKIEKDCDQKPKRNTINKSEQLEDLKPNELIKHRNNIRLILQCSNATPIRCRGGIGYACCFCGDQYPDPADLKKHTLEGHDVKTKLKFAEGKMMATFVVKLDITNLKCNICEGKFDKLEPFVDHLIKEHDKKIFTDIKSHVLPFKFDDDVLRKGHEKGTFKCNLCSKVFDTLQKKYSHEKNVHKHAHLVYKCGFCNLKFSNYDVRKKHLIKVHGVQSKIKCQACDKSYDTVNALAIHTRRDHLMERPHKCMQCDMKFFSSRELSHHMVKHTGVKEFQCAICCKSYGRKKTLAEHMKIHNDDRRFKCEHWVPRNVNAKIEKDCDKEQITKAQSEQLEDSIPNELFKHRSNIRLILQCSNATPIRCRGGIGYACCFCGDQYPDPADLKKHTLEGHNNKTKLRFMEGKMMFSFLVKLDITDLKCKICGGKFDKLEPFVEHLIKEHDKKIFTDIKSHVLPFKFDDDVLRYERKSRPKRKYHIPNTIKKEQDSQQSTTDYEKKVEIEIVAPKAEVSEVIVKKTPKQRIKRLLQKYLDNLKIILECSNATMILRHGDKGYFCCYCPETFEKPSVLKEHTLTQHRNAEIFYGNITANGPSRFLVKLDITDLKCLLCHASIDSLENLFSHLKDTHQKIFHTDIKDQIFPFKFNSDQLTCCMCTNNVVFVTFRALHEHMHKHYRNFICQVCDAGFINNITLSRHSVTHTKGSYKCRHCDSVFNNVFKRRNHEMRTHTNSGNVCHFCNQSFKEYIAKEMHLSKVHNVTRKYNCTACDRSFVTHSLLKVHVRRFHLMEKSCKCTQCDLAFFREGDLKNHMLTHTGVKEFKCEVCFKFYAKRSTLNEHMRIHNNDRRFKCGRLYTLLELESKKSTDETDLKSNVKERKKKPSVELVEHRKAIREILLNCNATPIRTHVGLGYTCSYCRAQFPKPAELKAHTLDNHKDIDKADFMTTMIMANYVVKLDITGLKCNVCNEDINTLEDFVDHCQKVHHSYISKTHLSHILPFKFDDEGLRCMVCLGPFDSFRTLIKHMHVHYRNFICPICDAGFVNKYALFYHTETHEGASFVCDYCPKVLPTHLKKRMHEKTEHSDEDKINKCSMCEETFSDYVKKRVHLASVHGIVASATACQACDKVVASKKALLAHMKRVHLMEKPHKCDICDKKFHSTTCLKNHMVKHTGAKKFQCNICQKAYGRKKTLNSHMKTHDEDNHVKCEYCGQKFTQRYSLKCEPKQLQQATIKIINVKSEKKNEDLPRKIATMITLPKKITKSIIDTPEIDKHKTNPTICASVHAAHDEKFLYDSKLVELFSINVRQRSSTRIIKIEKSTKPTVELKFVSKLRINTDMLARGSDTETLKNKVNVENILLNSNANKSDKIIRSPIW
ncbi:hypothetical protein SFRURICE_005481 [Spodoptera frugiperda]|nr:hypothetical protein SFRURICE_005481 [Spodoptera frugiperda]